MKQQQNKKQLSIQSFRSMKKITHKPIWGLCFMILVCFKANSFSQNLQIDIPKTTTYSIDEIFNLITHQTNYSFIYESGLFKDKPKVKLKKSTLTTQALLELGLKNTGINFTYNPNGSIVLEKQKSPQLKVQTRIIKGRVLDEDNLPIPGANVIEKGTKNGTVSDFDGNFTLTVNEKAVIEVSYLSYKTVELTINSADFYEVILTPESNQLDGVVLIGYQKVKRSEIAGAVSSVNVEDMDKKAIGVAGFDRALGGLLKGVKVTQNTGVPGTPTSINIRGITSPLSGSLNQPLFVIDGVPVNTDAAFTTSANIGNPLLNLDPSIIKRIDVLKDAAATSIYGSRGANGVILIETTNGKRNSHPSISVSYTSNFAQPINTLKTLNAQEFKDYQALLAQNTIHAVNSGQISNSNIDMLSNMAHINYNEQTDLYSFGGLKNDAFGSADTDWNKEVYRNPAQTQQLRLGFSGGSETTDYAFNFSAMNQEGIRVDSKLETYNLHSKINSDLTDYLRAGGSINLNYNRITSGTGSFDSDPSVVSPRPDFAPKDEFGEYIPLPSYNYGFLTQNPNPLAELEKKVRNKTYSTSGNTYIEIEPIENLVIRDQINGSFLYTDGYIFTPKITQIDQGYDRVSNLNVTDYLSTNLTMDLTATYKFAFGKNNFNILGGAAWDRTKMKSKSFHLYYFPDDDILNDVNSGEQVLRWSSNELETGMNSLFSRISYNYDDTYNLALNFRSDASSKFGPGNKRGYFPSLSAGWNISRMNFMSHIEPVDYLNLRLSYGKTGSSNIQDFAYLQFFEASSFYKYGGNQALVPINSLPNPDIKWEKTLGTNVGLDFTLFNSKLNGSVDVYNRKTTGALAPMPVPSELGTEEYVANAMDLSNKGVEIDLSAELLRSNNFIWNFNFNWAFNHNKVEAIHGANIPEWDTDYYVVGSPVGTIMGYQVEKIIESQDEVDALNAGSPTGVYSNASLGVGDYLFKDLNGDGRITADDRTVIGNPEPKFFGGFSSSLSYKEFSLDMFFQYSVGGKAIWSTMAGQSANIILQNKLSQYANNTWTPEHTDARYARAVYNDPSSNGRISDRYIFDRSYLRLSSVRLTYNLRNLYPANWFKDARVFVSASNLFTITKWPGLDPGASSIPSNLARMETENVDPYPLARTYSIGLQLNL